jgi:hypothetical protein
MDCSVMRRPLRTLNESSSPSRIMR